MDLQAGCPLFRLPRELRDQIYATLFASTRLTFGERKLSRMRQRMKPAPNSLAVLRSCRRIYEETRSLWLGKVLFSFESVEDMMDKLYPLPQSVLGQIRFVRTDGSPVLMTPPSDEDGCLFYRVPYVLKLLPGLRLHTLTVLADTVPEVAYQTLDMFIEHGHGWKELRYIFHASSLLAFPADPSLGSGYRREPQPAAWADVLFRRDGNESGASVEIYRSTRPGVRGSVLNPDTRQPFTQEVSNPEDREHFGELEDKALLTGDEKSKEILVVVKRGRGADMSDVGSPPYSWHDPREWTNGRTWAQIRRECIDCIPGHVDEEADIYSDPEDYVFPPFL